jgi:CheY-like chemotaxis protein
MAEPKSSRDARAAERRLRRAEPEPEPHEAASEPETGDSSFDLQLGLHVIEAPLDTLPGELVEELLDQRAEPAAETGDGGLDIDLTFTLRPIDEAPAPAVAEPELVRSDPDPFPEANTDVSPAHPVSSRSALKAAQRAAVRRARIAAAALEHRSAPVLRDVLVLEQDAETGRELAGLLEGFGFVVHMARTISQALQMLLGQQLAAAFLDIENKGELDSAGIELCRRVKPVRSGAGGAPGLFVVAGHLQHADRVRATLAGSDRLLLKPLTRGGVVRALEDCGVALPRDPRRG